MSTPKTTVRLAAMADVHYTKKSQGALYQVFSRASESADIFLLCGDITNSGQPEEAHVLGKDLKAAVRIPIIAVLGNHDYESGRMGEVQDILLDYGVNVLNGTICEVHGIGFAGVKGFAGGFGTHSLQPWGEEAIKLFVQEAVNEAVRLESALAKLRTVQRIALLHYSPIPATIEGEHPEIFPFLGTCRLEEPLNRCEVSAAFHGHAHGGCPEGRTRENIPVYNVSMPVLLRSYPDRPPFRLVEMPALATKEV